MPEPTSPPSSLAETLREAVFPIRREDLLACFGHCMIQCADGRMISLADALSRVDQAEFRSISDVSLAIGEFLKPNGQSHL